MNPRIQRELSSDRTTRRGNGGWTFVEMLVAIGLSAMFLGAASLVFGSISANSKRLTQVVAVEIGANARQNFYGQSGSVQNAYSAPNFGRAAYAQTVRDLLLEDADYSEAVFCLPRQLPNTIRPEFLRYLAGDEGSTTPRPRLDSPEAFRAFLAAVEPTSSAIYDSPIRTVPAANRPNTTIYFLAPEADPGYIRVRAVYEIDLVPVSSPPGIYASVRRYQNEALTHYYDVYYPPGDGDAFHPVFAAFERRARRTVNEGPAIDRFKLAEDRPFYFLWLPDPAVNPYQLPPVAPSSPSNSPKQAYERMTGKSSLLLVLPLFPNL